MSRIACTACNKLIGGERGEDSVAAITGSICGDASCDVYYRCDGCGAYTVLTVHEPFLGEDQECLEGPLDPAVGDERVAVIKRCETPWDKSCRCEAHREYFGDTLD
jgi:hypothetical protein